MIGSGTISESNVIEDYSDVYTISDDIPPIRYIKYEVVGGTHWADLGEMEVKVTTSELCEICDLNGDGKVNFEDFRLWLTQCRYWQMK